MATTLTPTTLQEGATDTISTPTASASEARSIVRRLRRRERLDQAHRITARVVLGGIALQVLFAASRSSAPLPSCRT